MMISYGQYVLIDDEYDDNDDNDDDEYKVHDHRRFRVVGWGSRAGDDRLGGGRGRD